MTSYSDRAPVEGSGVTLTRMEHGVFAAVNTNGLTPGHAVTLAWVVFNDPSKCSGGACGGDDVFNMDAEGKIVPNADGSVPMNREAIEEVGISILRADGRVIDEDGSAAFRAHLPVGDTSEAVFGPGLLDPQKAEIHLVVRTHQEAKPGMTDEMLNSINGGCASEWPNEPCKNLQFSVFKASAAS